MKPQIKIDPSVVIKRLKYLTGSLVNSKIIGNYRSVFKGKGLEFEDYRHYTPDDDASSIDWKASVRSKELLVKEFVDERNVNVFFLIDVGSSMIYTSHEKLKIEYAAELVATLAFAIQQAGDSIGFALFNDNVGTHILPAHGVSQYYKLLRILADSSNYGGGCNLEEALKFTMTVLKEYSVVLVISDFIGLKDDWKRFLKIVGKKYDLIGVMIRDPLDDKLPDYKGMVNFEDSFSTNQIVVPIEKVNEDYERYVKTREREISDSFKESGADFVKLMTNVSFVKPISDLFLRRAKRIR